MKEKKVTRKFLSREGYMRGM